MSVLSLRRVCEHEQEADVRLVCAGLTTAAGVVVVVDSVISSLEAGESTRLGLTRRCRRQPTVNRHSTAAFLQALHGASLTESQRTLRRRQTSHECICCRREAGEERMAESEEECEECALGGGVLYAMVKSEVRWKRG